MLIISTVEMQDLILQKGICRLYPSILGALESLVLTSLVCSFWPACTTGLPTFGRANWPGHCWCRWDSKAGCLQQECYIIYCRHLYTVYLKDVSNARADCRISFVFSPSKGVPSKRLHEILMGHCRQGITVAQWSPDERYLATKHESFPSHLAVIRGGPPNSGCRWNMRVLTPTVSRSFLIVGIPVFLRGYIAHVISIYCYVTSIYRQHTHRYIYIYI